MHQPVKISIVGASGYSGAELLRILISHKYAVIDKLFANSSVGKNIQEVIPSLAKRFDGVFTKFSNESAESSDFVFVALPSGEAMKIIPELVQNGKRVIDLGGDFRLKNPAEYTEFYKRNHVATEFLPQSVYGLSEWNRNEISSANLVANPGCYPTSALLPLLPLLKDGLISPDGIVITSLSGTSGAGKGSSFELSFSEINESVRAYKVGEHQHIPEIRQLLATLGREVSLTFVPHLLPITRGMYTTTVASLIGNFSSNAVSEVFEKYYGNSAFVRCSQTAIPDMKHVVRTNFIDIGWRIDEKYKRITLLSTIDNLVKGAAGQAVQNLNLMVGFSETEGLW